jgi:hypothetical protein
MSQNREPPAYLEYAAAMLVKIEYLTMRLPERGLFDTMRRWCWVNKGLPGRHDLLAKVLGVTEQEIDDYLPAVMPFFSVSEGLIFCPELEDYRKHLEDRKEKQSRGGKTGSALTNKKRYGAKARTDTDVTSTSSSTLKAPRQLTRRGQVESLIQPNPIQTNQPQSLEKEVVNDTWLDGYDAASNESSATPKVKVRV